MFAGSGLIFCCSLSNASLETCHPASPFIYFEWRCVSGTTAKWLGIWLCCWCQSSSIHDLLHATCSCTEKATMACKNFREKRQGEMTWQTSNPPIGGNRGWIITIAYQICQLWQNNSNLFLCAPRVHLFLLSCSLCLSQQHTLIVCVIIHVYLCTIQSAIDYSWYWAILSCIIKKQRYGQF